MPMTPGCQSSRREHVGRLLAGGGDLGLGLEDDARLDVAARGVRLVELGGDRRRARSGSSVSSSSTPASARCMRPAALSRGARRKPTACSSTRGGVDAADAHQRAQARRGASATAPPARRGRAGGSRRAAGRSRRSSRARRRRGRGRRRAGSRPAAASSAAASLYATPAAQRSGARVAADLRMHDRARRAARRRRGAGGGR